MSTVGTSVQLWYDNHMRATFRRGFFILSFSLLCLVAVSAVSVVTTPDYQADEYTSGYLYAQWQEQKTPVTNDDITITLMTVGRGNPVYTWFGHSALIVDGSWFSSLMYDYGIFDFGSGKFYLNFAMGRLYYQVLESPAYWRLNDLLIEKRDVTFFELNLPQEKQAEIADFLKYNAQPEHASYFYHHYYDNCSTRLRDIINQATDGTFKTWADEIGTITTFRKSFMLASQPYPAMDWVLNFLQSGRIDHPITLWDAMFLPAVLEKAVMAFGPTSGGTYTVYSDFSDEHIRAQTATSWKPMILPGMTVSLIISLISILLLFAYQRTAKRIWRTSFGIVTALVLLVLALLGCLLFFMMFFTTHDVTWNNENIVFVNPLLLILMVQAWMLVFSKKASMNRLFKGFRWFFCAGALLILAKYLLPGTYSQFNWQTIATVLPYYGILGWGGPYCIKAECEVLEQ